ncbi:hypothetical protein HK099_007212 [Clydaea vesicula]|uniref:methionine--tRNA ligase n=1 Tax=Clydaea vesicula TaxID=447962 RepID=A0AAD5TXC4_9FUNG|nr:hypothetical protein HK099_007212 [Clydaea vesicula]
MHQLKVSSFSASQVFKLILALESNKLKSKVNYEFLLSKEHDFFFAINEKQHLFNPNSAVKFLLSEFDTNSSLIEFEETLLNSVVTSFNKKFTPKNSLDLKDCLTTLESKFGKDNILVKDSLATDFIIFSNVKQIFKDAKLRNEFKSLTNLNKWYDLKNRDSFYVKCFELWEKIKLTENISSNSKNDAISTVDLSQAKVKKSSVISLNHHEKIILPKKGERNILITSALPYVNNFPHLGNIVGAILSADVFARYCRLQGYNTLYICGTDEYGTATETKALTEKVSCQELCDKFFKLHKEIYNWFEIDFNFFGRTTTEFQKEITHDIFNKCDKNGFTCEKIVSQLYCEQHKSFLADRFVAGTCPLCNYEDAAGDQCDKCGKLLDAIDLINPKCKIDGASPVVKNSKHLFLDLAKLQPQCEEFVSNSTTVGKWSPNAAAIANSWLKEGIKPRCITRDLKWGTSVPKKGYEDKVFYVWFDAPIGYPSITANYTKDWEKWWKNDKDVKYYEFMGKDNVQFHSIVFPSLLLATGDPWTFVHHINATEWLQYENTKFSKSKGVGVFGNDALSSGVPADVYRYFLLSIRPETNDAQFTWKALIAANNNELLANLGNFVNRLVKFVNAKYDSVIPKKGLQNDTDKKFLEDINVSAREYVHSLEAVKLRQGLKCVMDISTKGNTYLQDNKLDNNLFENHRGLCNTVVVNAVNLAYLISALIYPYLPNTAEGILRQLNLPNRKLENFLEIEYKGDDVLEGHRVNKAEYLFKRMEEKLEETFKAKYGGSKQPETSVENKNKKKSSSKQAVVTISEEKKTEEYRLLEKQILEQGLLVRRLKEEKSEELKVNLDLLLKLKKDLEVLTKKLS